MIQTSQRAMESDTATSEDEQRTAESEPARVEAGLLSTITSPRLFYQLVDHSSVLGSCSTTAQQQHSARPRLSSSTHLPLARSPSLATYSTSSPLSTLLCTSTRLHHPSILPSHPSLSSMAPSDSKLPPLRHGATPAEQQAYALQKLLANPDKPVHIPEPPPEGVRQLRAPREMMKNVQGSSAGAGSGEFVSCSNALCVLCEAGTRTDRVPMALAARLQTIPSARV